MIKSLELEISSILHCLSDNSNIELFDEEYYLNEDVSFLYKSIKDLYKIDGIVTLSTLSDFLIFKNKKHLISYIDYSANPYSIDENLLLLRKRYNRRLIDNLRLSNISDEDLVFSLQDILGKYKGSHNFRIDDIYDKTISYLREKRNSMFPIGIGDIDSIIDLSPDRYITIGGASGSGKTAFTTFLIDRLCKLYSNRISILFISLEMSEIRIMQRLINLNMGYVVSNENADIDKLLDLRTAILSYPLKIVYSSFDLGKLTSLMQGHINEAKRSNLVPICFLDHYGEITGLDEYNAKSGVDKITSVCKNFAMQGGIMVGLTQLRKDLLDKRNKETFFKPDNSYIMNSQSVEARSDIILHLWRPEYHNISEIVYTDNDTIHSIDTKGSVCLVVSKNRDGCNNDIWLNCDIATNYFEPINTSKHKTYSS